MGIRTAPLKPKLAASHGGISAAACAVPVNSYLDAAQRGVIAQQYSDKEVTKMLQSHGDELEVLAPKKDRLEACEPAPPSKKGARGKAELRACIADDASTVDELPKVAAGTQLAIDA